MTDINESESIPALGVRRAPRPATGRDKFRPLQAAAYLGVSVGWLNVRRTYGGGPKFAKFGRAVVYSKTDLDAWFAAHSVEFTAEAARLPAPTTPLRDR